MKEILSKNRCALYFYAVLCLLLLVFGIDSSYIEVNRNTAYYTRAQVVLYLKQYGDLPINYLTKTQAYGAFGSYMGAISSNYNIGGDLFRYEGSITALTKNEDLRECDLYPNRQETLSDASRGKYRMVYSADGDEVFYTNDHYVTFVRITWFGIQWRFVMSVMVTIGYIGGAAFIFIRCHKQGILTSRHIQEDGKRMIENAIDILLFPFRLIRAIPSSSKVKRS